MYMEARSISTADLEAMLSGSLHEQITLMECEVENRLGSGARVLSVRGSEVYALHDGKVLKFERCGCELGEELESEYQSRTLVGESVELRERAMRAVEALMAGDLASFQSEAHAVGMAARPEHIEVERSLEESIEEYCGGRGWTKFQVDRQTEMRKFMRGTLGGLKERRLSTKYGKYTAEYVNDDEVETESLRHEVLPELHALKNKIAEMGAGMRAVEMNTGELPPEEAAHRDLVSSFAQEVMQDVDGLHAALEGKLAMSSRTAPVRELAKLHDSLVGRVNEIDFAKTFYEKAAAHLAK